MAMRSGEHERRRERDLVDIRAIVILEDVAVGELEPVIPVQLVVRAGHPLIPIVEVILEESVPGGVQDPVGARVAAVVAVDLVRARVQREYRTLNSGIDRLP